MRFSFLLVIIFVTLSACGQRTQFVEPVSSLESVVSAPALVVDTVSLALVALDDNGKSGTLIGCGDSIVLVSHVLPTAEKMTQEEKIKKALQILFVTDDFYGASGLYNALGQSLDLSIASIVLADAGVTVSLKGSFLSGGVCDDPRITEQLRETIRVNSSVATVEIFINNQSIEDYFHG